MLNPLVALVMTLSAGPIVADLSSHATASETLRNAVEQGRQARQAGRTGMSPLLKGGIMASEQLGDSPIGLAIEDIVGAGRWRALTEPESAFSWLESELNGVRDDLEFEPILEAALPLGFPGPTPVREIELKQYPAYRSVSTNLNGDDPGGAFWKLFKHITSNDIAMTAPVEMSYDSSGDDLRETKMAFLYGEPQVGTPGHDGVVEVIDANAGWVVSIGCRGRETDAKIREAQDQLVAWIAARPELNTEGDLRVMGYNSPMVFGEKRYFEVQLPVQRTATSIVDFGSKEFASSWQVINDSVMGGRSTSMIWSTDEGTGLFIGNMSLENNGGFASVRSGPIGEQLAGAGQVTIRFRGDGQTYKMRMYTDTNRRVAYQAPFETTKGEWSEHTFVAADFTPVWRGRVMGQMPALDFALVSNLGLILSDGQEGPFRIELSAIETR